MIISFVILHYESIEDTEECIDSLKKYQNLEDSVNIVVVDNGSIKGKLTAIENKYKSENIFYIYSEENLGFAKGNNLGYKYAKNELKSDIIILSNNDIVYKQEEFIEKLKIAYEATNFDIAGPQIISLVDGKNQNPVPYLYPNKKTVKKRMYKYRILRILCKFDLDLFVRKLFAKEIYEISINEIDEYQLHGACLIFSKGYIEQFDGLYDGTFMYMEEGILKYMSKKYKLNMCYIGEMVVWHKEGSSTGKIYGEGRKKREFYYKWNIDGCKHLITLMKKN